MIGNSIGLITVIVDEIIEMSSRSIVIRISHVDSIKIFNISKILSTNTFTCLLQSLYGLFNYKRYVIRCRKEANDFKRERNVLAHRSTMLMQSINSDEEGLIEKLILENDTLKRSMEDDRNRYQMEIITLQVSYLQLSCLTKLRRVISLPSV